MSSRLAAFAAVLDKFILSDSISGRGMVGAMTHHRFVPDHYDSAALDKGWGQLKAIVEQLVVMAAMLGAITGGKCNAARHLCRMGESLARRILTARAMMAPLPVVRSLTRAQAQALKDRLARAHQRRRQMGKGDAPTRPAQLKLAEPLATFDSLYGQKAPRARPLPPAVRVEQYGILTVVTYSTHGDRHKPPLSVARAPIPETLMPPSADDPAPGAAMMRRIGALQAVIDRPDHHVRRMGRWIARQRSLRFGRHGPLRPGRPPGHVRDKRQWCPARSALSEADCAARRALATGPPRIPD